MTEFWKSNPMHWCDVCKCWMNDNKATRMNHERGAGHQAAMAKKLRDMARKADADKRQEDFTTAALSNIERQAAKAYAADKKAAAAAAGSWSWEQDTGYYYNPSHRWYYDPKTKFYYGGEPAPQWTQSPPSLPANAHFGVAPHSGGPVAQTQAADDSRAASGAAASSSGSGTGTGSAATHTVVVREMAIPLHPLAQLGGHQAPLTGKVGGAMGAGMVIADSGGAGDKRKRDDAAAGGSSKGGAAGGKGKAAAVAKAVDPEEAAALARREAARSRVQARTAAQFGYM